MSGGVAVRQVGPVTVLGGERGGVVRQRRYVVVVGVGDGDAHPSHRSHPPHPSHGLGVLTVSVRGQRRDGRFNGGLLVGFVIQGT